MTKTIHICDKCKCENITDFSSNPKGWVNIKFNVNSEYCGDKVLTVCTACAQKAGLKDERGKAKSAIAPGVAEQLLDLIAEIAQEAVNNALSCRT